MKRVRHRGTANPELAKAMRELRRSSAAQPHTPNPLKGSRQARKRQAINDYPEARNRGPFSLPRATALRRS